MRRSVGIGFAIPADRIRTIATQLITLGYVPHPDLGIGQGYDLSQSPSLSQLLNLNTDHGILVTQLTPGGSAARAGIRGPSGEDHRSELPHSDRFGCHPGRVGHETRIQNRSQYSRRKVQTGRQQISTHRPARWKKAGYPGDSPGGGKEAVNA